MIEFPEYCARVIFAAICGLAIGMDREIKKKPLGARAYMLIASGAAALMVMTLNFALSPLPSPTGLALDPTRLIQGVVGGIGFLGAGAIMSRQDGRHLRGVASGAAVWGAGAVGIASGLGFLAEAGFLAALISLILNLGGALPSGDGRG